MTESICKICGQSFYARPANINAGWGIYCSKKCKDVSQMKVKKVFCFICHKEVLKTPSQLRHSKSGKYFCGKSCQTKWRNSVFVGPRHTNFKDGKHSYQSILKRNNIKQICNLCGEKDVRVLAVHHVDENRNNNVVKNLAWLCHNCHSLVHYDSLEKQKFLEKQKQLK